MIVLLNGPAGVGKTTVARALARLHPGTVCIHGDELRNFVGPRARPALGAGSTYRAGAALAGTYLEMGAARVIFEYVFENRAHVDHFRGAAPRRVPLHLVTLWAPLDVVKKREAARPGRASLGPRVRACHRALASHLDELGTIVDARTGTPATLARRIDALLPSP